MPNDYWRDQKSWPVSQTAVSWLIVILFVALAGDWNFWREIYANHQKIQATAIYPGMPEYDQVTAELEGILESIRQKAKDGSLTVKEAAEKQMMFIDVCSRKSMKWEHYTTVTCLVAKEFFIANWKPTADTPDFVLEDFEKNPQHKRHELECRFLIGFFKAREDARQLYPGTKVALENQDLVNFGKWAFKWYWLLTLPSLIILLINRRYKGESVKEELLLKPWRLLLACCGGPVGILCVSETAARALVYCQLEEEFRLAHDYRWPDAQERQAILRQLEEPLLRFDEALAQAKNTTVRIRRPITVCLLAWLIGIFHFQQPAARSARAAASVISVIADSLREKSFGELEQISAGKKKIPSGIGQLLAVLPGSVVWRQNCFGGMTIGELRQWLTPVYWLQSMPRAPPAAAKEQSLLSKSFTLGCTQKG